ncbi:hypothetical protein BRADI_1g59951v3 [Brachypodium distachyon]|uniref:Uncharacterized protein n=1 Tax=Brachypodium distachyon TaxID=15368 RepID=A0A2K2DSI6_BRADI|nr:hypothetical protein BRADI_1g59951v3 [Brachypodium distachyon]
MQRVVWRVVGSLFGAQLVPSFLWQLFAWMHAFLPKGDRFFVVGLAAIVWATWKCRNRVTFENYKLKSPFEIVFAAYAYLMSWAGLQKGTDVELLKEGTKKLVYNAQDLMRKMEEGGAC